MIICIAGKNEIACQALTYLIESRVNDTIIACKNKNDDGMDGWQPSFAAACNKHGIRTVELAHLYELPDLVLLSLEFDRIIKPSLFKSNRLYNIHFSKLPAYKGMFTSVMPLINGELESGVTLHCIDKGIDTGGIIDQVAFNLPVHTNARALYSLYLEHGIALFKKNIETVLSGDVLSYPQPVMGSTYFSKSTLNFSNLSIDLNKTAYQVHNQVRAFAFRDYQLPKVLGYTIYRSAITDRLSTGKPGSVVHLDAYKLIVDTIDYQIELFIDKEEELLDAAAIGDLNHFKEIEVAGFPINIRSKKGWDALIVAAYNNQEALLSYLLAKGWDVNTTNYKGTTALMYAMTIASKENKWNALHLLAGTGKADWTKRDYRMKDIFEYAEEYGNHEVITFISRFKV